MSRIFTFSALAVSMTLAACGGSETPEAPASTPAATSVPETTGTPGENPAPLPAASAQEMAKSWTGSELTGSDTIAVAVDGLSAILTRAAPGEDIPFGRTSGAVVEYPLPKTAGLAGKNLKVTVTAEAVSGDTAPFSVAYTTAAIGNSGFRAFEATTEPQDFSFEWQVPDLGERGADFIGIVLPEGSSIRVDSIEVADAG